MKAMSGEVVLNHNFNLGSGLPQSCSLPFERFY